MTWFCLLSVNTALDKNNYQRQQDSRNLTVLVGLLFYNELSEKSNT